MKVPECDWFFTYCPDVCTPEIDGVVSICIKQGDQLRMNTGSLFLCQANVSWCNRYVAMGGIIIVRWGKPCLLLCCRGLPYTPRGALLYLANLYWAQLYFVQLYLEVLYFKQLYLLNYPVKLYFTFGEIISHCFALHCTGVYCTNIRSVF